MIVRVFGRPVLCDCRRVFDTRSSVRSIASSAKPLRKCLQVLGALTEHSGNLDVQQQGVWVAPDPCTHVPTYMCTAKLPPRLTHSLTHPQVPSLLRIFR